jgi:ComF family protein
MIRSLLFPEKCVLCKKLLESSQIDLCNGCRIEAPQWRKPKDKIPFIKELLALWHYEGNVRSSLLRYKFYGKRSYHVAYGRLLAMKLLEEWDGEFDLITWVPISRRRKFRRGYDQVELLAKAVGKELGMEPVPLLKKVRHNRPQSGIPDAAKRRANVLGAYRAINREAISGKRILLLDDILTTGATAGECARVLLTCGAKEIHCAAVAAARK